MTTVGLVSSLLERRPALRAIPRAEPPAAATSFAAVARAHEPALQLFANRLTGGGADARDLVQDTLERAMKGFAALAPSTNARAWLFTIMHNAFIDRCRRRAAEPRGPSIDEVDVAAAPPAEPPAWTRVTAEQLAAAIAALDEDFRAVYRLHAIDGLAYQEIAARLGIPMSTVGTRLARARRKLRALLENAVEEEAT